MENWQVVRGLLGRLFGTSTHGGARNLWNEFGYPPELTFEQYMLQYERGGIAQRIVSAYPEATWKIAPVIRDEAGDSAQKKTASGKKNPSYSPFVEACQDIWEKKLLGHYLARADRIAGIGHYSVLLFGFSGADAFDQPLGSGKRDLLYMTPYNEAQATISEWETDTSNPRFGLPRVYTLQKTAQRGQTQTVTSLRVHASRVLHLTEGLESDEVYGQPTLKSIYNYLIDLEKVVGGSAETFWLSARPITTMMADKEANISDSDKADMKKQADELEHQLRRMIVGQGMQVGSVGPTPVDPKPNAETILDLIAGTKKIPKRILIGSERGELSSAQDENNFQSHVESRRTNYAAPRVLRPLVDMLIAQGVLPNPKGEYWIEWPEDAASSDLEAAEIAEKKALAVRAYSGSPSAGTVIAREEFRKWVGEEPESEYDLDDPEDIETPLDETDPEAAAQFATKKATTGKPGTEVQ